MTTTDDNGRQWPSNDGATANAGLLFLRGRIEFYDDGRRRHSRVGNRIDDVLVSVSVATQHGKTPGGG